MREKVMTNTDLNLQKALGLGMTNDTLISLCPEEKSSSITSSFRNDTASVYEGLVQKLEAEVRGHFRFQQQLKLHIEIIEEKLLETEKANKTLKT